MAAPRHIRTALLLIMLLAGALIFAGQGVAMATCAGGVADVAVDGDTCGTVVSASVTGDADTQCAPVGNTGCVAVSGTGDASNTSADFSCGSFIGASAGCVALSGTGSASNTVARNCGYAGVGVFAGCIAVSGTGNASNSVAGNCGSETTTLVGLGCIAISGMGNASNSVGAGSMCGDASVASVAIGCMAASGTGDASNSVASSDTTAGRCGTSSLAVGVGCVAVSGQGSASNSAENCGTGDEVAPDTGVDWPAVGCEEIEGGAFASSLRTIGRTISLGMRIASAFASIF